MIEFKYLTGRGNLLTKPNILSFLNEISDELSFWGSSQSRYGANILADFDASISVVGDKPSELPTICKEFQAMGLPLPSKVTLQRWNELIFSLYSVDFIVNGSGERGIGVYEYGEKRLYGGHLNVTPSSVLLSMALSSIEVQRELLQDLNLGLQSLMAIISNLESEDLLGGLQEWRLALRPGMLYEEIFNGRENM